MNEAHNNPAVGAGGSGTHRARGVGRADGKHVDHSFSPRRALVYLRNRKMRETTEIKWNYDLEVYECVQCHAIMYYDFRFRVCPYCERRIVHTDERRF